MTQNALCGTFPCSAELDICEIWFMQLKPLGELGLDRRGTQVVKGLHNWYQFHLEQKAGRLTYTPPPKTAVDTTKKVRE